MGGVFWTDFGELCRKYLSTSPKVEQFLQTWSFDLCRTLFLDHGRYSAEKPRGPFETSSLLCAARFANGRLGLGKACLWIETAL